jgi:hypothetical protein
MMPTAGATPDLDHAAAVPSPTSPPADPVAAMLLALRDACGFGVAAMQGLAGAVSGGAAPGGGAAAVAGDLLTAALRAVPGSPPAAGDEAGAVAAPARLLAPAMLQAASAASASAFRYWQELADIAARHQAPLLQAMRSPPPTEAARAADEQALAEAFRVALREAGDLAVFEARRLQRDFEGIAAEVARTVAGQPVTDVPFRRRWKAKE